MKALVGASLGFIPHQAERLKSTDEDEGALPGYLFRAWEPVEWAVCMIPANRDTVSMILGKGRLAGKPIVEPIRRCLEPWCLPRKRWDTGGEVMPEEQKDIVKVEKTLFRERDDAVAHILNRGLDASDLTETPTEWHFAQPAPVEKACTTCAGKHEKALI